MTDRDRGRSRPCRPFLVLAALLAASGVALAAPPDEDCLACHEDPKQAQLKDSIHGQAGLACTDCHADLAGAELPHAEKLQPAACASCHEDAGKAWAASVHAERAGERALATCAECHGGHDVRPASDRASRSNHFNVSATCTRCHGSGRTAIAVLSYEDSIHARGVAQAGLVVAPNCAGCHGAHDVRRKSDPESRVSHAQVPGTCGRCHEGIRQEYETSVHWERVQAGRRAAVCSDCHSSHAIPSTELPAWRLEVIRECGACHEEQARTYRSGFHGKVTSLGYARVATCNDCHGSHAIRPGSEPASRVHPVSRVATCARCHPRASASFAEYDPHADPERREKGALLYYTNSFMKLLLAGVFSFFGLHTALWLPRSLAERRARRGGHS
jgi:hypothetical protein